MDWLGKWLLRHAGDEFQRINNRLDEIEVALASDRMTILETADIVAYRLSERERKRAKSADREATRSVEETSADRWLGAARRFGKS